MAELPVDEQIENLICKTCDSVISEADKRWVRQAISRYGLRNSSYGKRELACGHLASLETYSLSHYKAQIALVPHTG